MNINEIKPLFHQLLEINLLILMIFKIICRNSNEIISCIQIMVHIKIT